MNRFPKDVSWPNPWEKFSHVGNQWLETYLFLFERNFSEENKIFTPHVLAFALGISIELYLKSLVSLNDLLFSPKKYLHNTTKLIHDYEDKIQFLGKIYRNKKLMTILKSYEDTVETKYGDTDVSISDEDEEILRVIEEIKQRMPPREKRG